MIDDGSPDFTEPDPFPWKVGDEMKVIRSPRPFPFFDAADKELKNLTEGYVYSTVLIGQGAEGEVRLFTVPRGQFIPALGKTGIPVKSEEKHTNVMQAGELGPAFGDARFGTIRVQAPDMGQGVWARLKMVVAGEVLFESPLNVLLNQVEPKAFQIPIPVVRSDTLEVRITFDRPTNASDLPFGESLLRVELAGVFARDAR